MGNRNKDIEKLFEQKNLLECKIKMIFYLCTRKQV